MFLSVADKDPSLDTYMKRITFTVDMTPEILVKS